MKKRAVLGIFALLYLFLCAEWGELSGEVPIRFFTTGTFFGYVFGGCLFQLFKESSGSIWLPVLLHGLMDYSVILAY